MRRGLCVALLAIAGLFVLHGCASPSDASFSGSFADKFERYTRGPRFSGPETHAWTEVAWRGDRLYKQVVLWTDRDRVTGVRVEASDLVAGSQRIDQHQIRVRREGYVKGDADVGPCGYAVHDSVVEIADALLDQDVTALSADDPVKLWVTIDVPPATLPGPYTGTIRVSADHATDLVLTIELDVRSFVLPEPSAWTFHLDLWQHPAQILSRYNDAHPDAAVALWSDEHFALLEPSYRILADAGQKVITTHIKDGALGGPSMITWIRAADGSWRYDMTAFDRYVTSLEAWGITKQISAFSIVGWNPSTITFWDEASATRMELDAPVGSALFAQRWEHFLTELRAHLKSNGWFDKTVLYMDEVDDDTMTQVIDLVRANSSDWKMGLAYFRPTATSAMYDLSAHIELATASSNPVSTFYTACAPAVPNSLVTTHNDPAEMSWMAWYAQRAGLDGYLRWAYDLWLAADAFDVRDGANPAGDFSLLYYDAEANAVASSIRLELLRDGIQDFERTNILRAAGYGSELDAIIAPFSKDSGADAHRLVTDAQRALRALQ